MGVRQPKITAFNQYHVNGVAQRGSTGNMEMDLVTHKECISQLCDPIEGKS